MNKYNTCDKCRGNIRLNRDNETGEWYEFCLECGLLTYLPEVVGMSEQNVPPKAMSKYRFFRKKQAGLPVGM